MSTVTRIGGALLVASEGRHFVVGETKRPVDWTAEGFERPAHIEREPTNERIPWFELSQNEGAPPTPCGSTPALEIPVEGEAACSLLHERLTIRRNGSVSERLWALVIESSERDEELDARWLSDVPAPVWEIVRDAILKCV